MNHKPVYVLGTGLSHDGSSCLLKDGIVVCAIEKERLTRKKHDGGNDALTVQYCLDAAGITVNDLSLVVQAANFEKDEIQKHLYRGKRLFAQDCAVPFVSISHHLAHAYSAIGTSPFSESNVLIIDGCGSPYHQCDDLFGAEVPPIDVLHSYVAEKDSFYFFSGDKLGAIYKDFSEMGGAAVPSNLRMPTTRHSIGGLYSLVSQYVFGNMDDAGKLMGLAPYGSAASINKPIFTLTGGRAFVNDSIADVLQQPSVGYEDFKARFAHFADIAAWAQKKVEEAIIYLVAERQKLHPHPNLCYAGGVALNAVANSRILRETGVERLYMAPAAADNGLSLGCAYYGWLAVLQQERVPHNGSTYLGKTYGSDEVKLSISEFIAEHPQIEVSYEWVEDIAGEAARLLAEGKVMGWYQGSAEFGPRALGNRSILADGRKKGVRTFINRDIKFREDFRPFAPSVMAEDVGDYFEYGYESPYMILVDKIKDKYKDTYEEVVHVNGSARVQTVTQQSNPLYYSLLQHFKQETGWGILVNTSLNRRGMPIVETPAEALSLFYETKMDVMVIHQFVFTK